MQSGGGAVKKKRKEKKRIDPPAFMDMFCSSIQDIYNETPWVRLSRIDGDPKTVGKKERKKKCGARLFFKKNFK